MSALAGAGRQTGPSALPARPWRTRQEPRNPHPPPHTPRGPCASQGQGTAVYTSQRQDTGYTPTRRRSAS